VRRAQNAGKNCSDAQDWQAFEKLAEDLTAKLAEIIENKFSKFSESYFVFFAGNFATFAIKKLWII
jgi:hypothetical protein